jgi:hypothetical protein
MTRSPTLKKPLSSQKPSNVKDRVREWQSRGGGVVSVHDDNAPIESPIPSEVKSPQKRSRRPSTNVRAEPEELPTDSTPTSQKNTPRKRVVSDDNWTKRSPAKATTSGYGRKDASKSPDDGIRIRPMPGPDELRSGTPRTPKRKSVDINDGIRVTPMRAKESPRQTPTNSAKRRTASPDDGIRVRPSRRSVGPDDDGIRITPIRKKDSPEEQRSTPIRKPIPIDDDGIRVRPMEESSQQPDLVRDDARPRRSVEERSRSRERENERRSRRRWASEDDKRRSTSPHRDRGRGDAEPYESDSSQRSRSPPRRRQSELRKSSEPPALQPRRRHSRRPSAPEELREVLPEEKPAPAAKADGKGDIRRKISLLRELYSEGKKILKESKGNERPPPSGAPGDRIKGWIFESANPYVEPDVQSTIHSQWDESESQVSSDSKKENKDEFDHRYTSNEHRHEAETPKKRPSLSKHDTDPFVEETPRKTSRDRIPKGLHPLNYVDTTPPSIAGLKRSTRVTPNKTRSGHEHDRNESIVDASITDDQASLASSNPPIIDHDPLASYSFNRKPLSTIASVETFEPDNSEMQTPKPKPPVEHPIRVPELYGNLAALAVENPLPSNESIRAAGLKRRLTNHADLMSVLSMPKCETRSIRSARSIRSNKSKTATIGDFMTEMAVEEAKYLRELRTLVDGVIPVLLTNALSDANNGQSTGLFNPSEDPHYTRPIIEMGVALERLKMLHRQVPLRDADAFMQWADGAYSIYAEYLKVWRMGYQDLVVTLAPAEPTEHFIPTQPTSPGYADSSYGGISTVDENGDLLNSEGQSVDVAYLLKRPLLRIKNLSKVLRGLHLLKQTPASEKASSGFQQLSTTARRRNTEERARLEDLAASRIDAARTRDLRSLAPTVGTIIDKTYHVNAKDVFHLHLPHSSGQAMDCQVELILRDKKGKGDNEKVSDLLVCEMDETDKWLLFPPISAETVSARTGDRPGEIIVMIRGQSSKGEKWQEFLILRSDDEGAGFEWVQLLGLLPVPPEVPPAPGFASKAPVPLEVPLTPTRSIFSKPSSPHPRGLHVPIGELPEVVMASSPSQSGRRDGMLPNPLSLPKPDSTSLRSSPRPGKPSHERTSSDVMRELEETLATSGLGDRPSTSESKTSLSVGNTPKRYHKRSLTSQTPLDTPPQDLNDAMSQAGSHSDPSMKRTKAKRMSRILDFATPSKLKRSSNASEQARSPEGSGSVSSQKQNDTLPNGQKLHKISSHESLSSQIASERAPLQEAILTDIPLPDAPLKKNHEDRVAGHAHRRSRSSDQTNSTSGHSRSKSSSRSPTRDISVSESVVYSTMSAPTTPTTSTTPRIKSAMKSENGSTVSGNPKGASVHFEVTTPTKGKGHDDSRGSVLSSASSQLSELPPIGKTRRNSVTKTQARPLPPLPPPHAANSASDAERPTTPNLSPRENRFGPRSPPRKTKRHSPVIEPPRISPPTQTAHSSKRRSSSPLKHEYAPSSGSSESESESEDSGSEASSFSSEEELEDGDMPTPLLPVPQKVNHMKTAKPLYAMPHSNVIPSVEQKAALDRKNCFKTIASIYAWSDSGTWEKIHPDECSIVILPGLIEAYEMSAAHSRLSTDPTLESTELPAPLVALELTPLVPIRRGTVVDISIRSPPTKLSKLQPGNNLMFRARSPPECDTLYGAINHSRINNPTYIALQTAREPYRDSINNLIDGRHSNASRSFWSWSSKSSGYRASGSAPAPSLSSSEGSFASLSTAFSALRKFGNGGSGRIFSISRSSVSSRTRDARDPSTISSSVSSGSSLANAISAFPTAGTGIGLPVPTGPAESLGLSNAKIRLYRRETASKWQDLGSARLTISRPLLRSLEVTPDGSPSPAIKPGSSSGAGPGSQSPSHPHQHQQPQVPAAPQILEEKRILIIGKKDERVLLDVCLSESCFERVARTGIALSVWEETKGPNGELGRAEAKGGVAAGRMEVYMLQVGFPFSVLFSFCFRPDFPL